jgi:hypothetical protein
MEILTKILISQKGKGDSGFGASTFSEGRNKYGIGRKNIYAGTP